MSDEPIPLRPEGVVPPPEGGPAGLGPEGPPSPFSNPRSWMLLVPVVFGSSMLLAGAAWLLAVQTTAGVANGPKQDVTFDSTCAIPVIDERIAEYGFPGTWSGSTLRLTLAGVPGEESVPAALAAPGRLVLHSGGQDVPFVLVNGGMQISLQGTPVALFTMQKDLPSADLTVTLDGAPMEIESVNGSELMLASRAENSMAALRKATDWVVAVKHPLPCAIQVLSVAPVAAASP